MNDFIKYFYFTLDKENKSNKSEILKNKYKDDNEKFQEKLDDLRNKEIKILLFDKYLRETNNEKGGVQSLDKYFIKK